MDKHFNQWSVARFVRKLFLNKNRDIEKRRIKSGIRTYFEGVIIGDPYMQIDPIVDIPILQLGITNVAFKFKRSEIVLSIWLYRPGLLIGKGGRTIDGLMEYLSDEKRKVKISIHESKSPI